jgi:hypothetical protein
VLVIQEGGVFEGNCRMVSRQRKKDAETTLSEVHES